MASKKIVEYAAQGGVKPILSVNRADAHHRVLGLYRAWYRQIPYILHTDAYLPLKVEDCRNKLREMFYNNAHVTDTRVIDTLVLKGHMELNECVFRHKTENHLLKYFRITARPRPKDFLSRFIEGKDSE